MDEKIYEQYLKATGQLQETEVEEPQEGQQKEEDVKESNSNEGEKEEKTQEQEIVKSESSEGEEGVEKDEAQDKRVLDYDAILKEKLGDSVNSWDELKAKLEQKPATLEFEDEESKSLYQAIKDKKLDDIKRYAEYMTTDFDSLESDELAVRYLSEKRGWSKDKINDYLSTKYWLDQDENDELLDDSQKVAIKRGKYEFEDLVEEAKSYFKDKKKEIKLPDLPSPDPVVEDTGKMSYEEAVQKYNEELVSQTEGEIKQWETLVESELKDYSKSKQISINLGDSESGDDFQVSYQMSDKDMQELNSYLKGYVLTEYDRKFVSEDGKDVRVDVKSLADDVAFRLFGKKIMKSALKEYAASKMENFLEKDLKNADYTAKPVGNGVGDGLNWAQRFIQKRSI